MTEDEELRAKLREMSDRAEILDCMQRYARGMDRLDRELVRSAYHDDAIDDHSGFVGPVEGFIEWAFDYHSSQTRHQHYLMNHTVELDGDGAHAETYYLFIATDCDPEKPLAVYGGRYVDRLERRSGRWGIVARVCLAEWHTETTSLMKPDAARSLQRIRAIARDHSDLSYNRPLVVERETSAGR